MADENTDITKLQAALQAERDAHKATKAQYLAPIRTALGLGEDANLDTITASLGTRLGDADKIVADRTAALTAERDAAIADAAKVKADRAAERVDSAISGALAKSNMIQANAPDAMNLLRGLFHVDDKGRVVTKGGDTGEPAGVTPEQFVAARLGAIRSHWFPGNVSGGARSSGNFTGGLAGDTSCFDPRSPNYNITRQYQLEVTHGSAWADAARKRYGGTRR